MGLKFCSLASGSSGNCQLIGTEKTSVLLDAGLSGKYIQSAMAACGEDIGKVKGILVTHEHSDHIKGIGVLMRRFGMNLFTNEATYMALQGKLGAIDENHVILFDNNKPFAIDDLIIKPFSISHDAVDPVAYSFTDGKLKFSVATDLGTVTEAILSEIIDSDLLMLESNHDVEMLKVGPYPYYLKRRILSEVGHLSNDNAADVALEMMRGGRIKSLLLAHLSKENNHPELALETVKAVLEEGGVKVGEDLILEMTWRDRVSRMHRMK